LIPSVLKSGVKTFNIFKIKNILMLGGFEIVGFKAKKNKKTNKQKQKKPSHAKEIYPEIMKYS
jgi:hypothetical protein